MKVAVATANVPIAAYAEFANPGKKNEPEMNKLMPQLMGVTLSKLQFRFEDGVADEAVVADTGKAAGHGRGYVCGQCRRDAADHIGAAQEPAVHGSVISRPSRPS